MCVLKTFPRICSTVLRNPQNTTNTNNLFRRLFSSKSKYDLTLAIRGVSLHNYIKQIQQEFNEAKNTNNFDLKHRIHELQPIITILNERKTIVDNLKNLEEFFNEKDDDIKNLAQEEQIIFENKIKYLDKQLLDALIPSDKDDCGSIVLEVSAGVGGQEAMLFASELFDMYSNFAEYRGWGTQIAEYTTTDLGGIRHGSLLINGNDVFRYFRHEAGVHRVQRIPATEKAGRIHTSTVSVTALPQGSDIEINIDNKDLKIETKRASGAGGQHVNTTDSAVRIYHIPTGLVVGCQVDRSQQKNKQIAMTKLRALLYQKEMEMQEEKSSSLRKTQVRSNYRNEKIRTYNFPQDRITDHRLQGYNVHNINGFMQGSEALKDLIDKVDQEFRLETLLKLVNNVN